MFFPEKVCVDIARHFAAPIHSVLAVFFRQLALLTGPGLLVTLVGVQVRILGKLRDGRETHAREAANEVGELVDLDILPERRAAGWASRTGNFIRASILLRSPPHLFHAQRADAVAQRASGDRIEHDEHADRTLDVLVHLDEARHGDFIGSAQSIHLLEMTCAGL